MSVSTGKSKIAYTVLTVLFVGTLAFQLVISGQAILTIWSQSQHFRPEMITGWILELFAHILAPLACLFLGFYVAKERIWDLKAWLLLALLISFSLEADGSNKSDEIMLWATPLKHLALIYRSFGLMSFPFWLIAFAIYFPQRTGWERRNSKLKWLVLIPAACIWLSRALLRVATNENGSVFSILSPLEPLSRQWISLVYFAIIFFLVVLSLKLVSARTPDDRRRLRVLLFGITLTLVPLFALDAIARILHVREDDLPAWLAAPAFLLVLCFPVTIAYVTVVQRTLDVGLVIRESLQYALARRGVVVLQIVVSLIVIVVVAALGGNASFLQRLVITAFGIAAILLIGFGGNRLAAWIDRRFFREAYNAEQILNGLAASVTSIVELGPLLKTVTSRIAEALHIKEIAVFLYEQNLYHPAFSLGYSQSRQALFGKTTATIRALSRAKEPLPVYFDDPRSWVASVDGTENKMLRELDAQLLLPLARKDELLGFIALGAKYAEAPYSSSDLNLLQSVASQTSLAIENSRLTAEIAGETAQRQVVERELAIAREVQQRLFPQSYPPVPGLEYGGTCRPAQEVGGDYYDFLELQNGNLGVAIGDISGKGIPASLLMASLQACLRGQTIMGAIGIDRMLENINRLIYAATPTNRYATFFYGQYDPGTRRLVYVNAGHNAPIVLRKRQSAPECIRLEAGGPPVGLLPQAKYESAYIDLEPGDVVVLFTDGISEAMNIEEEEWDECRLIEAARTSIDEPAAEMMQALFRATDAFTAGAPQHDDMTVVVARIV